MRDIWDEFEKATNAMMRSVNGKQIALWGYGYSGWFVEHILGVHGRKVDYRFDVDIPNKIACDPPTMLYEINWDTCFMIITVDASEDVLGRIERMGISEGKHYLFAKKLYDVDEKVKLNIELYDAAVKNLRSIGMDASGILCGDAQLIEEELDQYNYFYFYNPFVGETLLNVIHNIEKSFDRKKRKITLIYRNPRCSVLLRENSKFVFTRKIYNDSWVRNIYVYLLEP